MMIVGMSINMSINEKQNVERPNYASHESLKLLRKWGIVRMIMENDMPGNSYSVEMKLEMPQPDHE